MEQFIYLLSTLVCPFSKAHLKITMLSGGAIGVYSGRVSISDSTLRNNSADGNGGTIHVW